MILAADDRGGVSTESRDQHGRFGIVRWRETARGQFGLPSLFPVIVLCDLSAVRAD